MSVQDSELQNVTKDLNILLADLHIYYQNLRSFHWNIQGEQFFILHEQFEELYNDAKVYVDDVAERILTIGGTPASRMAEYLEMGNMNETDVYTDSTKMVEKLLADHTLLMSDLRTAIESASEADDEGTIDLLGAMLREVEKKSWMFNAWKKRQVAALAN